MTKTELLENYTAEQLADMVEKLDNENTGLKKEILKKTGLCGEAKASFGLNGPECRCGGYDIAVKKNKELQSEVVKYKSASEIKNDEIHKLKWQISSLEEESGRLQAKLDTYNNYLLPRCTKEAKEMIDRNGFNEVMIVTYEEWANKKKSGELNAAFLEEIEKIEEYKDARAEDLAACGADLLTGEVEGLNYVLEKIKKFRFEIGGVEDLKELNSEQKKEIDRIKSEVDKYRKALEDAKKERDCQVAEYRKKIDDLEHDLKTAGEKIQDLVGENMKLQCERNDYKSKSEFLEVERMRVKKNEIADFLPTEPIKVAEMLITAKGECEPLHIGNGVFKDTYRIFDVSELRQIAEHLLIYCNHNGEAEE